MGMKKKKLNIRVLESKNELVLRSGIGVAIHQQISILNQLKCTNPDISVNKVPLRKADIVHINTVFPDSVLMALYAKLHGCRIIYFGHSTKEDWRNSFKGSNLTAPFIKLWFMFCYQLGDVIITPSAYSKKILKEYGIRKPVFAVSNGIDTDYWKRGEFTETDRKEYWKHFRISSDRKIIMSVGHYMERKGFPEFCNLARKNPDIDFIWFGFTSAELDQQFQGEKYIFTLGNNNETVVTTYDNCEDDTYERVIKNVAIGTGVILVCVTVSVVSGGVGAAPVCAVFAASAIL